jgi:hypothetical protein
MYRKPRFLEVLHEIREEMSREADYDSLLFAEMVRSGRRPTHGPVRHIRGFRSAAPAADAQATTEVAPDASSSAGAPTRPARKRSPKRRAAR